MLVRDSINSVVPSLWFRLRAEVAIFDTVDAIAAAMHFPFQSYNHGPGNLTMIWQLLLANLF